MFIIYYVLYFRPKKKKMKQIALDVARIESLQDFLHQEPGKLKRSESQPKINSIVDRNIKVSK